MRMGGPQSQSGLSGLYGEEKISCSCRESTAGRPGDNLVVIPTELSNNNINNNDNNNRNENNDDYLTVIQY
jgi:hypothetical protein